MYEGIGILAGKQIYLNPNLVKRKLKKICRTHKRRIVKKWLKNPRNYSFIPDDGVYAEMAGRLFMHPATFEKLLEKLSARDKEGNL